MFLLPGKTSQACCKAEEDPREVGPKNRPVPIFFKVRINTPQRTVDAGDKWLYR